jgi:hypothetical protein
MAQNKPQMEPLRTGREGNPGALLTLEVHGAGWGLGKGTGHITVLVVPCSIHSRDSRSCVTLAAGGGKVRPALVLKRTRHSCSRCGGPGAAGRGCC